MTSTISLPAPTPVPPPPPSLSSSSSAHGMNGITGLTSISSTGHYSSSGINSSDGRLESLNSTRNGKLLSMSSAVGINGGTGQQAHSSSSTTTASSSSNLPTLNEPPQQQQQQNSSSSAHQDSESDAETVIVVNSGRGRSRSNRPRSHPEQATNDDGAADDDRHLVAPSAHSRRPNGDSKSGRSDRDNGDDYSSELSSAPSSRAPSSKRPLPKDSSRKRTASPSRLTHSPPRRKIPKIQQEDDPDRRRSLKRKAREEASLERGIKSEDESPRGIRIKSSPPMSPPPVPRGETNGTKHSTRDSHSTTNTSSANSLSRPGHSRKRSVPSGPSANSKMPAVVVSSGAKHHKAKKPGRPPALHIQDSDNEGKSTSSSRSNSPQILTHRRRRPSISGPAASPARLVGPGHKMKRDKTGRNQLHKICSRGGLDEAKACLVAEPELLNEADNAGYLPIHAAALDGHNDIVEWLIEEGALVDKPAIDLSTPLLDAVENMHIDVVNTLLEHGADPRHKNKAGQSSIDLASTIRRRSDDPEEEVKMGQIEEALRAASVKMKKKRADDEARKTANESSSSRAASVASPPPQSNQGSGSHRRGGRAEPTRKEFLWLDAGKGGQAKLRQASRDGDIEMVGKLLESFIQVDTESMVLAARGGHVEVLNLLVAFGGNSDPDPKDAIAQHAKEKSQFPLVPGEETPLLAIIGRNNIEGLKLLLGSKSMKDPRRLDSQGRSYVELAKQRAGENWEEEVRLLQAAWDAAGPSTKSSKKSAREKADTSSSSPIASRKDKDSRDKESRKSERKEAKAAAAEEAKKTKRLRRRSASLAASSAMDDTAPSEREISPAISRSKFKDLEKQKRKERTVDSDYSAISDSNATVDGTKSKRRRLVLGKDLAAKSEKEDNSRSAKEEKKTKIKDDKPSKKRSDDMEVEYPTTKREKEKPQEKEKEREREKDKKKKEKAAPAEDDDVEMPDAPRPKKRVADPERHSIKRERDPSLDKRQRESSSSSNRPPVNDHNSDVDVPTKVDATVKKRRKLEDDVEATPKAKSKEERQPEATEERVKTKEERKAERESRRAEADKAAKLKAKTEKAEKSEKPASTDIIGKDTDEALLERKREKKKRREEALREAAAKESESSPAKRSKDRDTTASDIEGKKSRSEKVSKDKDAMDIDSEVPSLKRSRKPSGDSNAAPDDATTKLKKRKSNGASPAPSANDEKNSNRHLSEVPNGKSNRGSSIREEIKPKAEPEDDRMAEVRELEMESRLTEQENERKDQERKKQEAAAKQQQLEEKRREQERLEQEAAEKARLEKLQKEEEQRKLVQSLRHMELRLNKDNALVLSQMHHQAQGQLAKDLAAFEKMKHIHSLPLIYRDALIVIDKDAFARGLWQEYRKLLPLYCVQYGPQQELWCSNAQACVLLGIPHDLDMTTYPGLERRPVSPLEKYSLKQNWHPIHSLYNAPTGYQVDAAKEMERQEAEKNKFYALPNIWWFKVDDLYKIFTSNERYRPLVEQYMRNGRIPSVLLTLDTTYPLDVATGQLIINDSSR